jgi:uncharacterized protein (TIGR02118 family)
LLQGACLKPIIPMSNSCIKSKSIAMAGKLTFFLLLFICAGLISCKTTQTASSFAPAVGMFKVTILYPNGDGKTFDMDYYEKKHMPMVAGFLGKNLKFYEIDKGIAGRTPADKVPFLAAGYFYISDVAEYNKSIAQNRDAIVNDFKNYTNIQPVILISEIKQLIYNTTK